MVGGALVITADTITDEQIRELRSSLREAGHSDTTYTHECDWALSRGNGLAPDSSIIDGLNARRNVARARCAQILNAREASK